MYATENTESAPITEITRLKKIVGEIIGTVTLMNRCQRFAPSMWAASYNSCGTPWRPARKTIILLPPAVFQSERITSEGTAQVVLWTQGGPGTPIRPSR